MPAAAVIPAPIAYIKVVAVKKLVVESVSHAVGSSPAVFNWHVSWDVLPVGKRASRCRRSISDGRVACGQVRRGARSS